MKAIAKKPHQDSAHKKGHDTVHSSLKNAHSINNGFQTSIIQLKPICPCDGGCPRCAPLIQPKLTIGAPNDKYEQEADRVADEVLRMPEPEVQTKPTLPLSQGPSCGDEDMEGELIQTRPIAEEVTPLVQRQVEEEEEPIEELEEGEGSIMTKALSNKTQQHSDNLHNRLNRSGGGYPLPETDRDFMERSFGIDFRDVRVHTDSNAVQLSRELNAEAFTHGRDIYLGTRRYNPGTPSGKRLMAHELTHVVQQRGANKTGLIQRKETKADQAKRLKEVNKAALTTARTETKVPTAGPHWAKALSSAHLTKLSKVINYLNTAITDLKAGAKKVDAAMNKLTNAIKKIRETKNKVNELRAKGYYSEISAILLFVEAKKAVDEAGTLLKESKSKGINGLDKWVNRVNAMSTKMYKAKLAFMRVKKVDLSTLDLLRDAIKKVRSDFGRVDYKFKDPPVAAQKVQFVLRYFLALNITGYSKTPSLGEAAAIRTRLGTVAPDMVLIFGGNSGDYALFSNFESQLREQIWVRSEMKKALGTEPGLKPSESDVKRWFKSLKISSNAIVINAYRNFASGFFIHRHEADPAVVSAKQTLTSIFARPTTLSGARLAVCSGFAVLGKALLEAAGAKFKKYYVGIRASDYQIKCSSTYSDVHALTHLKRIDPATKKIQNMYVSNDDIVFKKDDGLGSTAVAWKDKSNPIYEGSGKTLKTATKYATNKITAKRKTLGKISCK